MKAPDRQDISYIARSKAQKEYSPNRNLGMDSERVAKRFDHMNKKVNYMDEKISRVEGEMTSLLQAQAGAGSGCNPRQDALELELQELKLQVQRLIENDKVKVDKEKEQARSARLPGPNTLEMDRIYDVLFIRLKTQLKEITQEAFREHSVEQEKQLSKVMEESPSYQELLARSDELERELLETKEELAELKGIMVTGKKLVGHGVLDFQSTSDREALQELREMCSQIDSDAFENTKRLFEKVYMMSRMI